MSFTKKDTTKPATLQKKEELRNLLSSLLTTPGFITTAQAHKLCPGWKYPTFWRYFFLIMQDMKAEGLAENIYGGMYKIIQPVTA